MGMGQIRISLPERRDRSWLLSTLAVALLTLLGAVGQALGFHRPLEGARHCRARAVGASHAAAQRVRLRLLMEKLT